MGSDDYLYDNFEPASHDLEDQVARNEAYGLDLEHYSQTLRARSLYWYAATLICFVVAVGLGVVTLAPLRIGASLAQAYTGQTFVTTILALAMSAAVTSFSQFTTLRRLAAARSDRTPQSRRSGAQASSSAQPTNRRRPSSR